MIFWTSHLFIVLCYLAVILQDIEGKGIVRPMKLTTIPLTVNGEIWAKLPKAPPQ